MAFVLTSLIYLILFTILITSLVLGFYYRRKLSLAALFLLSAGLNAWAAYPGVQWFTNTVEAIETHNKKSQEIVKARREEKTRLHTEWSNTLLPLADQLRVLYQKSGNATLEVPISKSMESIAARFGNGTHRIRNAHWPLKTSPQLLGCLETPDCKDLDFLPEETDWGFFVKKSEEKIKVFVESRDRLYTLKDDRVLIKDPVLIFFVDTPSYAPNEAYAFVAFDLTSKTTEVLPIDFYHQERLASEAN